MTRITGKMIATYKEKPQVGGTSLKSGADRSVTLFDAMATNDATLFVGGKSGADVSAAPMSVMTVLHEFGHITGYSANIQGEFHKKFIAAKSKLRTAPLTWYAKSDSGEFFPEAFAVYNADPQWMKANLGAMFAWFEELSKTGNAPP